MKNKRDAFEAAVIERMKDSGFLEAQIRTECLARSGDDYQDELINYGWWGYQAALQSQSVALLAKKHTGMMVDYTGLIGQARSALKHGERSPALAEMLNQLARHIKELGEGWYSGDTAVVDEFLQLYCVEDDARRRIEGDGE